MVFDIFHIDLFPKIKTIMNSGVFWGVFWIPGQTDPRYVRKLLNKHDITSWDYSLSEERWRNPLVPNAEDESGNSDTFLTREELTGLYPALDPEWGKAIAESRRELESNWTLEDWQEAVVTVFVTPKKHARRAYQIMRKEGYMFYEVPNEALKGG